jgi:hypothetical protein
MKYLIISLISLASFSQTTNLGLQYHNTSVSDGYTLFTPEQNNNVYLINNCGEKINEWLFNEKPGATCYLLENGNLLRAGKDNIEIRDWDNTIVWTYATTANGIAQHHDIEPLPNGNILCVVTDQYTIAQATNYGRNPAITGATFKLDKIVELQPNGMNNANIVWEWKFTDHIIQDFDNTKLNFGVVENFPELVDINFDNGQTTDWTHVNAIDYNPNLDQVMISVRHLSEIFIVDHSTTTVEASGHTGGNFNKGGDILWRWGNPQVYRQGNTSTQKLFLQHDSKWVETGYLDEGKITVFNNGGDGTNTFSSVHLITPQINSNEYVMNSNMFLPNNFEWSWNGSFFGNLMNENKKCGVHGLPNGNFIICETSKGRISEITKTGVHLWSYKNPTGSVIYNQGDPLIDNTIFRGEKYPSNYIGFIGKDLTPIAIIENVNVESSNCIASLDTEFFNISELQIVNPIQNKTMQFNKIITLDKIQIFDLNSRLVFEVENFTNDKLYLDLNSGIFIVKFINNEYKTSIKKIIIQ